MESFSKNKKKQSICNLFYHFLKDFLDKIELWSPILCIFRTANGCSLSYVHVQKNTNKTAYLSLFYRAI